jgi:hypothetical protein
MLRKSLLIACAFAFVAAFATGTASAQDNNWNQRTYFTFSAPVELPGKTLPAGTYLFKVVDSPSNRHVIQVFDKDEKEIHATLLAIPAQRLEASDEPEVRFMEVAANQPAAIRTWWYPGRTIGHEFIYPKSQATRLAKGAGTSVLTVSTDAETTETMREASLARVDQAAQSAEWEANQAASAVSGTRVSGRDTLPPAPTAPTTVPQATATTQREVQPATPAPATSTASVAERTELPHTATFLPLLALIGFGSLSSAAALRLRRK